MRIPAVQGIIDRRILANYRVDGIELRCRNWSVDAVAVESVESSYFEDTSMFPAGSVQFDSALLMRGIDHTWHGREDLCCESAGQP